MRSALAGIVLVVTGGLVAATADSAPDHFGNSALRHFGTRALRHVSTSARQPPGTSARSDRRLSPLKDLDGHFPFTPSATPEEWQVRAQALRRQIRVALGLWPWPTRTPLNAVVHGPVARDGYVVEKVFFESVPGHFVTGSLYRPTGRSGRLPAVLSPHGHWPEGRFQDVPLDEVREQLAAGAERFETGGRHPLQARAVQLARMGAIVFLYDMIGYADSVQIPRLVAHRGERDHPATPGLFFSPDAELHLESIMGLQVWNGIRALDWLASRPDVDPARIAVTGASGGATQTMMIAAVDERPAVSFPAVMVSTGMQGGCTCENADYLRVGTSNVEVAALFAPRPLGMTAADDWTRTMPEDGYPALQQHYAMLGVPDRVKLFPFLQFGHNYNAVSRTAMYGWMNEHLGLGWPGPVIEQDFVPLTREEASVWTSAHPAPKGGEAHERAVTGWWRSDAAARLQATRPRDSATLAAWREIVGGGVAAMVGRGVPGPDAVVVRVGEESGGASVVRTGHVEWTRHGERVAFTRIDPATPRAVAIWLHDEGMAGLFERGEPTSAVRALVEAGVSVIVPDLFLQASSGDVPANRNRLVTDRPVASLTFGYNRPLVVQRVHDTLALIRYARESAGPAGEVWLVGVGRTAGVVGGAARAVAGDIVDRAAIGTGGFRLAEVTAFHDPAFLPGAVKYGDVPGLLALQAPEPLWLAGEPAGGSSPIEAAYRAAGAAGALTISRATGADATREAVDWLVRQGRDTASR